MKGAIALVLLIALPAIAVVGPRDPVKCGHAVVRRAERSGGVVAAPRACDAVSIPEPYRVVPHADGLAIWRGWTRVGILGSRTPPAPTPPVETWRRTITRDYWTDRDSPTGKRERVHITEVEETRR